MKTLSSKTIRPWSALVALVLLLNAASVFSQEKKEVPGKKDAPTEKPAPAKKTDDKKTGDKKTDPAPRKSTETEEQIEKRFRKFWEARKITLEKFERKNGSYISSLKDELGRTFLVRSGKSISELNAKHIIASKKLFYGWKFLTIRKLRFYVFPGEIEIHIHPRRFFCGRRDYVSFFPAGLLLNRSDILEYNFRLNLGRRLILIRGSYTRETEICEKVQSAVQNPRAYIRARNPEYVLKRLQKIEKRMESIKLRFVRLRSAIIALHNKGLFSGPKAPDLKALNRAVAIKRGNLALTIDQVVELLKKEGLKLSSSETKLMFQLVFNEFP